MKKCVFLLSILLTLICLLPKNADASIRMMVDVVGIELPVPGKTPDMTAEFMHTTTDIEIKSVEWIEYDEGWEWKRDMTATDTFKDGYWYVVMVKLEATEGNTFGTDATGYIDTVKVNNYKPTDNNTKFTIYTSYQCSEANATLVKVIDKIDLTVVKPVIGKTPTFAKIDTEQFESANYGQPIPDQTNGVQWYNEKTKYSLNVSNAFKEDCTYRLTYILHSKDGYIFNTETTTAYVNGVKAEISAGVNLGNNRTNCLFVVLSGIVPGDGKKEISSLELLLPAPKDGEKPTFDKIDEVGYYSDNNRNNIAVYKNGIAWYKNEFSYIGAGTTEVFKGGTDYIVKISLLPKDGYKFTNSVKATINGKEAVMEYFEDGSVNVSATLTALNKEHTHTASDYKNDENYHWKVCMDAMCGTVIGKKELHVDVNKDSKCDTCGYNIVIADNSEKPNIDNPGNVTPTPAPDSYTIGGLIYKITSVENKTVELCGTTNKKLKKLNVKATVTIDGAVYKVTSIGKAAFKNIKTLKSLTIGKNVTTIGNKAFFKCKELKKVVIKAKKLKKVGAGAFKKTNKKMTVKAPKKMQKKYKKLIKK